jgi:hypothetical protein
MAGERIPPKPQCFAAQTLNSTAAESDRARARERATVSLLDYQDSEQLVPANAAKFLAAPNYFSYKCSRPNNAKQQNIV